MSLYFFGGTSESYLINILVSLTCTYIVPWHLFLYRLMIAVETAVTIWHATNKKLLHTKGHR